MKLLYLLINCCTVIIPLIFSFHPRLTFYKNWKFFFPANIIVAAIFIAWDIYFTKTGVWGFNSKYVSGVYFFNLPIEEIFFFICIPFACVFSYHCLNLFWRITWSRSFENIFILILSFLLFVTGTIYFKKAYTASTFISLGILLMAVKFIFKVSWLPKLLSIYPILLIPFFIVNGLLTGSGLQEPVVWYNNSENLGVRLFTIPFEDIFYGFELILLNIYLYEFFKNKFAIAKV